MTLSHTVSGAAEYAGVSAGDIDSVTVTIEEDDAARVSINPDCPNRDRRRNATGASYAVVLDTQPTADVTVTISGHSPGPT